MTNRLIELHDSEVLDVKLDAEDVIVELSATSTSRRVGLESTRVRDGCSRFASRFSRDAWFVSMKGTYSGSCTARSPLPVRCSTTWCPRPWRREST